MKGKGCYLKRRIALFLILLKCECFAGAVGRVSDRRGGTGVGGGFYSKALEGQAQ